MKTNKCPFCESGELVYSMFMAGVICYECTSCKMCLSQNIDDNEETVYTRPIEDGLQAEIEELKKTIIELIEKGDNFAFTADDDDRFKKTLREWNEAVIRSI